MLSSPQELQLRLEQEKYVASDSIATILFLAISLGKPLLVEGPAGVGKTELAKSVSQALSFPFVRLQCYEGLDESKALYEWEYSKQLLYAQILKEKIVDSLEDLHSISEAVDYLGNQESAFFSEKFLLHRPLLKTLLHEERSVLLIDEIDKSDPEFEAFLLEFLSDFTITIPELGTFAAKHIPVVILTSNDQRDLSDALKRRCLHLFIDYPPLELEKKIIALRIPHVEPQLLDKALAFIHKIRTLELKKHPSISEGIDWIQSLLTLQYQEWKKEDIRKTLSVLLKYQNDVHKVEKQFL